MNINQDPVSRREVNTPPSTEERAAMRAVRDQVRTGAAELREATKPDPTRGKDRIEISAEATRRSAAAEAPIAERRQMIARLKFSHENGELNTSARREAAADKMMRPDAPMRPDRM